MTGIEHYFRKNLKLEPNSHYLNELLNYVLCEGYEVDFIKTSKSKDLVYLVKENGAMLLRRKPNKWITINEIIENITKRTTCTTINEETNNIDIVEDDYQNDEHLSRTIKLNDRGILITDLGEKNVDLGNINNLKQELSNEDLLLKFTTSELRKKASEIIKKETHLINKGGYTRV